MFDLLESLNSRGWLMFCVCVINFMLAVFLASVGSWLCMVNIITSFICWISLYNRKYQKYE